MKRFLISAILVLLCAATTSMAREAEDRDDLFYDSFGVRGYFHRDGDKWTETINGQIAFTFVEKSRNDSFIEIYDASRDMSVRLYDDSFWLRPSGAGDFTRYRTAGWDNRRLLSYGDPVHTYFNLMAGNLWKLVQVSDSSSPIPPMMLKEIHRDYSNIQLRSEATATTFIIVGTTVYRRPDGGDGIPIFSDGQWSKTVTQ